MGTLNAATVADRTGFQTNELLLLMGALVLLISCVNYANLASAQTLAWAKEVGLRRVVGAGRGQIVAQCLIEATLVMAIAFALAFALVVTVGVLLDPAASAQILRHAAGSFGLWVVLAATYLGAVLVAGGYPAFVLSSVRPAHVIRGAGARIRQTAGSAVARGTAVHCRKFSTDHGPRDAVAAPGRRASHLRRNDGSGRDRFQ